jgi:hypothetical protein
MTAALKGRLQGSVVEAVKIESLGTGTNSRARVMLTYAERVADRGDGESSHGPEGSVSRPSSVFVKRPGRLVSRLAVAALRAFATEARLAMSGVALPLLHPLPYAGGVDRLRLAAVVVTEDVLAGDGRPNEATSPLSVDEVRSGLEGLARLHAAYWDGRLPAALEFLRPWRLGRGWDFVSAASLARGLRRLRDKTSCALPDGLEYRQLAKQFRLGAVMAAAGVQTMLYGDPHPGNTYRLADGRTGFFDWQLARTGYWSHDVGYFLVAGLGVADRRAHERDLLAGYLDDLGAAVLSTGAAAAADAGLPKWEDAWARYRATPAFGLATWVHTFSFGIFQPVDVCLATIDRFSAAYDDLDTAAASERGS